MEDNNPSVCSAGIGAGHESDAQTTILEADTAFRPTKVAALERFLVASAHYLFACRRLRDSSDDRAAGSAARENDVAADYAEGYREIVNQEIAELLLGRLQEIRVRTVQREEA